LHNNDDAAYPLLSAASCGIQVSQCCFDHQSWQQLDCSVLFDVASSLHSAALMQQLDCSVLFDVASSLLFDVAMRSCRR
jgi:hypothetical protein